VVSEVGTADNPSPYWKDDHDRLHPWSPAYRYGGLTSAQGAESLVERYWDARLLKDANDPNLFIAGMAVFEWNDEWHKFSDGDRGIHEDQPEEHFGLGRFEEKTGGQGYQLRYKLQQETVRDLYTLRFSNDANIIESVVADSCSLSVGESTEIWANVPSEMNAPVRLRWEASRGYIIGDPNAVYDANRLGEANSVTFFSGNAALGPALITLVAIDTNGNVDTDSITIDIDIPPEPNIEILTVGKGISLSDPTVRASGRVYDVNLDEYKLVCYIYNWHFYIQPYDVMKSIWIGADGYWWTNIRNARANPGELYCWLVPESWDPLNEVADPNWSPPGYIAEANTVNMDSNDYNDEDHDLLPDICEPTSNQGRYDDPDGDGAHNLEEFWAGTSPNDTNDNDRDGDGLWDNWERHFFGSLEFYDGNDDPDGDGFDNKKELSKGLSPVRVAVDKDEDGLPDLWEMRWFNDVNGQDANDNSDDDCFSNLDEYELGLDPTICMGNLDCDWDIDLVDYSTFALGWEEEDCNEPDWCGGVDLDRSGEVNWFDLRVLADNWLAML
jgi:hypothetical protein